MILEIAARFANGNSERRKSVDGFRQGYFIVNGVNCSWQGNTLYRKSNTGAGFELVRDERLHLLTDTYLKALGNPPYKSLSRDDWVAIFKVIE